MNTKNNKSALSAAVVIAASFATGVAHARLDSHFVGVVEHTGGGVMDYGVVSVPSPGGAIALSVDDIKAAPGVASMFPLAPSLSLVCAALGFAGVIRTARRA